MQECHWCKKCLLWPWQEFLCIKRISWQGLGCISDCRSSWRFWNEICRWWTIHKPKWRTFKQQDDKSYVLNTITKFVEEHVVHQIPEVSTPTETKQLQCQICGKKYVRPHALQAHEKKIHAIEVPPTPEEPKQDNLYNYTHQLLIMLLLRANHDDAIKLRDGARVIRQYKYFVVF